MILSKAQAEAVYRSLCALNSVGGRADAFIEGRTANIYARELSDGRVIVHEIPHNTPRLDTTTELYSNQADFAAAYGLR